MSKVTCKSVAIALSIAGSQIPGFILWSLSTKASNEAPCLYRPGDINRAADRAGYQAGMWLRYPNAPQAPAESPPVPSDGTAASISGSNIDTAAAAGFEGDSSTIAPIYQVARDRSLEENVAEVDAEVLAGTYQPAQHGDY